MKADDTNPSTLDGNTATQATSDEDDLDVGDDNDEVFSDIPQPVKDQASSTSTSYHHQGDSAGGASGGRKVQPAFTCHYLTAAARPAFHNSDKRVQVSSYECVMHLYVCS